MTKRDEFGNVIDENTLPIEVEVVADEATEEVEVVADEATQ